MLFTVCTIEPIFKRKWIVSMKKSGFLTVRLILLVAAFFVLASSTAFSWGAINTVAETHQYILRMARGLADRDPAFIQAFPTAEELVNQDYIVVDTLGKYGPGPDLDGVSPYSWHYYNPLTGKGLAPRKVGDFFNVMMHKRVRREDQSREAAWAAHFLADMFVPYHVVGMPEEDAWIASMSGNTLGERESGPSILYSLDILPPEGWGMGANFSSALELLFSVYPPGNEDGVDWFDPWYFNGYGGTASPGIATGSHGWWEFTAWTYNAVMENISLALDLILKGGLWESRYDPLWKNGKSEMGSTFWSQQAKAAEDFAAKCAARTRQNLHTILRNPNMGIENSVRAVYTLYRASMTSIQPGWRQEALDKGYRIFCMVTNQNMQELLDEVDLRLLYSKEGKWEASNTLRINSAIPPGETKECFWDIETGEPLHCILEVSGIYRQTPDLGYVNLEFRTNGIEPEETKWNANPPSSPQNASPDMLRGNLDQEYKAALIAKHHAREKSLQKLSFESSEVVVRKLPDGSWELAAPIQCVITFAWGEGYVQGCKSYTSTYTLTFTPVQGLKAMLELRSVSESIDKDGNSKELSHVSKARQVQGALSPRDGEWVLELPNGVALLIADIPYRLR